MPYGTVNADVIQTSTSGGILGAGNASIMKNRIINGAMVIDQRAGGSSVTPASNTYSTCDRWKFFLSQASKVTAQQLSASAPVGFGNYLGITSTSAYSITSTDTFFITQLIEGYNTADLAWGTANAKTVTLSLQVKSSLTGTFTGSITNAAQDQSYPFSYTISSANTWEQKSITIVGPTAGTWVGATNSASMYVSFSFGAGSTNQGTAGAWGSTPYFAATGQTSVVGTNGATFYITGVQLEVGSSATGFEYVNYQTSLANCQRYYQISVGAVADNGASANTKYYYVPIPFKVSMRATPSASFTAVLSTNVGSRAFEAPTTEGGRYVVTASGGPTMADTSNVSLTSEL